MENVQIDINDLLDPMAQEISQKTIEIAKLTAMNKKLQETVSEQTEQVANQTKIIDHLEKELDEFKGKGITPEVIEVEPS